MTIRVHAPATTANIGPGFDCVAAALDLWNELEVEEGDGEADSSHLGVQAFAKLAPVEGRRFEFVSRIPRERGLGSSAAVIVSKAMSLSSVDRRKSSVAANQSSWASRSGGGIGTEGSATAKIVNGW